MAEELPPFWGGGGGGRSGGNVSLRGFFAFARNNPGSLPYVEAVGSGVRPLLGHRSRISGAAFTAVLGEWGFPLSAKNPVRIPKS